MLLKSGKSKELVDFLIKQAHTNNTQILTNHEVLSVSKAGEIFTIHTSNGEFQTKKLVLATGGKSYPQAGATDIGRQIASAFGHTISPIHPGLCGLETKENLSSLTGNSCSATINLYHNNKLIHQEKGPLLFTHRGVSGPTIFNTTVALGNYLNQKKSNNEYSQFTLGITIDKNTTIKKIADFFHLSTVSENILHIHDIRPRTEAKVTV
ncbi:TPA: hypothetical protein DEP21_05545 [Patescibacteria group bacterium]|nr:hypothetical protein [Candidatus Gracilibacteria bacterium]